MSESKAEISTFQEDMETICDFLVSDSTLFTTKLLQGMPIKALYRLDEHRKPTKAQECEALDLLNNIWEVWAHFYYKTINNYSLIIIKRNLCRLEPLPWEACRLQGHSVIQWRGMLPLWALSFLFLSFWYLITPRILIGAALNTLCKRWRAIL
mgnify:CR=1 FL=1